MHCTRRHWIASSVLVVVSGCLGTSTGVADDTETSPTETATATATRTPELPNDLRLVDGTPTVRFPAIADGEVSVSNKLLVRYTAPVDASFDPAAIHEGSEITDEPASDTLRVNAAIPASDPPTIYPVPVYREDTGFEYRFYANEAFVTMNDWYVAAGTGSVFDENGVGSRAASFEAHYQHVHRDTVTADLVPDGEPAEPLTVSVLQYPFEQLREGQPSDLTGVVLFGRRGPLQTPS